MVILLNSPILRATRILGSLVSVVVAVSAQQQLSNFDRSRAQGMLQVLADDVRKHYYDPKFHGVDWDAKVTEARQKIDHATSFNMAMSNIAAAFDSLKDSHTFLIPPQHTLSVDYGFQYQIVGQRCFVSRVRPKSDADLKGVRAGDEILAIDGYSVNRDDLWKMQYIFSVLRPQPGLLWNCNLRPAKSAKLPQCRSCVRVNTLQT